MRNFLVTAAALGSLGALASCAQGPGFVSLPENLFLRGPATSTIEEARATTPSGGPFATSLYQGYMEHAEYEYGPYNQDNKDAIYEANKAIRAAKGDIPAATALGERYEPQDKIPELTDARARLVAALPNGQTTDPDAAGKAQAYFDCWMEQQEENFQPMDIEYCRNGFFSNLQKIEAQKPVVPEKTVLSSDVFFDFDKSTLKSQFLPDLDKVADTMVRDTSAQVMIDGYTDTAGPKSYNQGLSERRASAVATYLERKGVTANRIVTKGFGETDLAMPTPDNTPEYRNRRVEIHRR